MDSSTDNYFATLGGSLMKDLLADLQVDDGDWSFEHLEKELAQLEHEPHLQSLPPPNLSAASLIVSHAQERSTTGADQSWQSNPPPPPPPGNFGGDIQGMDAWSLSLEKFTALSLEQDFLAADSVRKQQQHHQQHQQHQQHQTMPLAAFESAEDYDVLEKATLAPPPGLSGDNHVSLQNQLLQSAVTQGFAAQAQGPPIPSPKRFPKTPQNSLALIGDAGESNDDPKTAEVVTPQAAMPAQQVKPSVQTPYVGTEAGNFPQAMGHPQGVLPPGATPLPAIMLSQQLPPMPQQMALGGPQVVTQLPPQAVPVAIPAMGGPWQAPPMPPPPPPVRMTVYCDSRPSAAPIPASVLESKFMSARDIAYVVHSIMKPILSKPVSEDDYHIQFLRRVGGPLANPTNPQQPKDIDREMVSRAQRSKEWSSEKSVLGHVTKTNVTRPRALIATSVSISEQDNEQKQRATLWKARVHCDQAHQAFQATVELWKAAPPGSVPPQVQLHLVKLMKCMGISLADKHYQVDAEALKLFLKLSKGRALCSRALDQALLPPNAVQSFLPVALGVLLDAPSRKANDLSDDRLFRSIALLIQRLPINGETFLECLNVVCSHGKSAVSSRARMEAVHAMLQLGAAAVGRENLAELNMKWQKAEQELLEMLQGDST